MPDIGLCDGQPADGTLTHQFRSYTKSKNVDYWILAPNRFTKFQTLERIFIEALSTHMYCVFFDVSRIFAKALANLSILALLTSSAKREIIGYWHKIDLHDN